MSIETRSIVSALTCAAVTLTASSALAAYVDFTEDGGPDGITSWDTTIDGVTVTVTPEPAGSTLYWDSTDGFGVRGVGYEADEVEGSEMLVISLSEPVEVTELALTDLFQEWGYLETGFYTLADGTTEQFWADRSQVIGSTNGEQTVAVNAITTSITLTAPGRTEWFQNHEFSVAGISFNRLVPELDPDSARGAIALLASTLLLVGSRRRRRAAQA